MDIDIATTVMTCALTLWMEAGGESLDGKRAVASVVWERAGGSPGRLAAVCRAKGQFSAWNGLTYRQAVRKAPHQGAAWDDCLRIAGEMARGEFRPTIRAEFFHGPPLVRAPAVWGNVVRVAEIGRQIFYRRAS